MQARLARYAVSEVDNSRAEGAGLGEFEIHLALALGEERNAAAHQHRGKPWPGTRRSGPSAAASEARVAPPIAMSSSAGSARNRLDLLRQAGRGEAGVALHFRQRGGEHHLRERLPDRGPLEHRRRRATDPGRRSPSTASSPYSRRPSRWTPTWTHLVGDEAKDLLVRRRPAEAAVRPDDVPVKRDAHRIGHPAHQKSSSVTGLPVRPPDAAELIAPRVTRQSRPACRRWTAAQTPVV